MEFGTFCYIATFYVAMAIFTGWIAKRDEFEDEFVIICGFFWPLAIPILLFAMLVTKADEIMWERGQEPINAADAREIKDIHDRHAPAGDPDHWGSE